jgi:RND family efflux transporter MFP subunit
MKFLLPLSLLAISFPLAANVPSVRVIIPESRPVSVTTTQPAFAEAFHTAEIGSRVSGVVGELKVDIGQEVAKGEILAVISAPELVARRDALVAEKEVAATQLVAQKANLEAVEAETGRILELVKANSVTAKAGEEAKKKLASAKAQHKGAEAQLEAAAARVSEAGAMVGFATLRAPFDGVVTSRNVDPGDLVVGDSGKTLLTLASHADDLLRIVIHVPEKDSRFLDVGDAVELAFDSLPRLALKSSIQRISASLDPKTQRMRAEAVCSRNDEVRLYPGAYGRAIIILEKKEDALTLPAGAVRFEGGKPIVYVVTGGKVVHQPVTIGYDQGQWVEITSGLKGGEQVVLGTIDRLPAGTDVTIR